MLMCTVVNERYLMPKEMKTTAHLMLSYLCLHCVHACYISNVLEMTKRHD